MGVSKKHAKGRLDKFYHMAKEQGYRARSAFKLIQLNKKYAFLEKARVLVDLCAAPGGWLQVAQKYMPKSSIIIGLDLAPIKAIPGVITHVEDITTPKCRSTLKSELKTWKADVFLHDGAPNVGVSWIQDAFTQNELVLSSLKLATEFLVPNGVFVTKVFRSKDYNKLLWVFNQLFDKVEATKPSSSRNVSAEIFVVCRGYKSPKKIDPRLLDAKFVFKEIDDNAGEDDPKKLKERQGAILNDLFHPEKRKRHRDGYADGATVLYTSTPVSEFIRSPEFVTILAKSNTLSFSNPTNDETMAADHAAIQASAHTTKSVLSDIADLRNLGKKDFKDLIKWRDAIRVLLGLEKSRDEVRKAREAAAAEEVERKDAEKNAPETEESIAAELKRQQEALDLQKKKDKRKSRERKAKQLLRLRLGMETPMDIGMEAEMGGIDLLQHDDSIGDENSDEIGGAARLFEMANARKARQRVKELGDGDSSVTGASLLGSSRYNASDDETSDEDEDDDDDELAWDSDEEVARKVGTLEGDMDAMFAHFQQRRQEKDPKSIVKQKNDSKEAFEEWYGVEWEKKMQGLEGKSAERKGVANDSDEDSDSSWGDDTDSEDEEGQQSGARRQKRKSRDEVFEQDVDARDGALSSAALSKKARVFFDNPLFQMATGSSGMFAKEMGIEDVADEEDDEAEILKAKKDKKDKKKGKKSKKSKKDDDIISDSDDDKGEKKGFEIVRTSKAEEDFNQTKGSFILDTAEKYTMAQKLVTKSGKRDLMDDAFNRFAYNDPEDLPSWFTQDENRHNKINLPVTKEAMDLMRQKLRAMDARPIKKVAEAKFRQKLRAQNRLDKALKKAAAVTEDTDTPELSKMKDAAKIMAKAMKAKPKSETKYVVATGTNRAIQGRPKGVKGRYKMVDGVMKKEMMRNKRKNKAAKKGKRNK
ncbi:AdoMet-dependent rRNA methyltransferase spb1 [Chytriomyces hyalinus]|nr:AdoMet-dependent rRNA methyltransferase spb1 [Chytriomyces hyalinus]